MKESGTTATPRRLRSARGRSSLVGPLLVVASVLALVPWATVALFQLAPDAPSPATGHAQVIAHGVSALPAPSLAWRVVHDTAEPVEQAVAEDRALGFALADQVAILAYDQSFGSQTRLAAGEASFVPTGSLQRRSSLTGQPTPYYRIALVPTAQASDAGGDRLVFGGDAWNAPVGEQFDIDLLRDVVNPNEASSIPATNGATLVLVTSGTVEVEANGSAPVRLETGQAANFSGELSVFGVGTGAATFVAAALGPEVPPPPAPPTGSITINVLACPEGLTAAAAVAAGFSPDAVGACAPAALATDPVLILAGNKPLAPDQPNPAQGTYTWNSLLYSPFPVGEFELPEGYDAYLLVNASGIVDASETSGVAPTVTDPNVLFVGADEPNAQAALFLFAEGAAGGSLSLAPFACHEGMTTENFDSARCSPATGTFDVTITAGATAEERTLTDATHQPGSPFFTWSELPADDYAITVPAMPAGYTTFTIPGLTLDSATSTYVVPLTETAPEAQFNLFFLQEGDSGASGSITVTVFDCPPGMSGDALVAASCQPSAGFDLNLYPPTGGALGVDAASIQGNSVTWTDLPFAEYAIEEVGIPAGYVDVVAPGVPTSSASDQVFVAAISSAAPRVEIAMYNLQTLPVVPAPTAAGGG